MKFFNAEALELVDNVLLKVAFELNLAQALLKDGWRLL